MKQKISIYLLSNNVGRDVGSKNSFGCVEDGSDFLDSPQHLGDDVSKKNVLFKRHDLKAGYIYMACALA